MKRIPTFLLLTAAVLMAASDTFQQTYAQPPADGAGAPGDLDEPAPPGGGRRRGRRGPDGERGPGGPGGERGPRGPRGERGGPPPNPLMMALDVDGDHEISAAEIEGAIVALKRLDENGDGKLTQDELRPPRRGPGGPGGPGEGPPPRGARRERGQGPPDGERQARMLERIMQADTDLDGKISKDEARGRLKDGFDEVDADGSGFIDENELQTMMARGPGRRGGGRERPGRADRPNRPEPEE